MNTRQINDYLHLKMTASWGQDFKFINNFYMINYCILK